jgi:hypothetical protein
MVVNITDLLVIRDYITHLRNGLEFPKVNDWEIPDEVYEAGNNLFRGIKS